MRRGIPRITTGIHRYPADINETHVRAMDHSSLSGSITVVCSTRHSPRPPPTLTLISHLLTPVTSSRSSHTSYKLKAIAIAGTPGGAVGEGRGRWEDYTYFSCAAISIGVQQGLNAAEKQATYTVRHCKKVCYPRDRRMNTWDSVAPM